jgi:hypothetical protein
MLDKINLTAMIMLELLHKLINNSAKKISDLLDKVIVQHAELPTAFFEVY